MAFLKSAFALLVCGSLIAPSFAIDARPIEPEFAAASAANFLNRYKTAGEFLESFKAVRPHEEVEGWKKLLIDAGGKLTDRMPVAKATGDSLTFGGQKFTFAPNRSVTIKSNVYYPADQSVSDFLKEVLRRESGKSASRFSLISDAHAEPGLITIIAVTILGSVAVAAVVAGVLAVYIASEFFEDIHNGNVECHPNGFRVRKKKRNFVGVANHEEFVISMKAASEILKKKVTACNDATRAALKTAAREMSITAVQSAGTMKAPATGANPAH